MPFGSQDNPGVIWTKRKSKLRRSVGSTKERRTGGSVDRKEGWGAGASPRVRLAAQLPVQNRRIVEFRRR